MTSRWTMVTVGGTARFARTVAAVLAALLLTWVARRFADETMYVFFVAAVAVGAWLDGWVFGTVALVLSGLAVDLCFIEPVGSLRLVSTVALARLLSFTLVSVLLLAVTHALRVARGRSEEMARDAAQARDAAERASAARTRFLSTLSHEVRTPINAVLGYTDLLDAGVAGAVSDEQRRLLARMRLAARHLLSVVNGVLDVAKAEAGHVAFVPRNVAVRAVVDGAVALTSPQAERKSVSIAVTGGDDATECIGDPDRVRQVLINLLGNAVKFAPPGGRVTVTWGESHGGESPEVWIAVGDNGPGIAPEDQERIFAPFEQASSTSAPADPQGAGLGLAISRRLARLQGGDLNVDSKVGDGARFTLRLPATDGHN